MREILIFFCIVVVVLDSILLGIEIRKMIKERRKK